MFQDESPCQACADKTHPFRCWVCEHEGSFEFYKQSATLDELHTAIVAIKLCNEHAQELDRIHGDREKQEIERSVA